MARGFCVPCFRRTATTSPFRHCALLSASAMRYFHIFRHSRLWDWWRRSRFRLARALSVGFDAEGNNLRPLRRASVEYRDALYGEIGSPPVMMTCGRCRFYRRPKMSDRPISRRISDSRCRTQHRPDCICPAVRRC